jgi:ubiquinol-cytochrome c reductase cytochrome b subunit
MDDGSSCLCKATSKGKIGQGLKLSTNSFSFSDCNFLVKVLYENFKLKATVQKAGVENQYFIYIWKDSMPLLREIVLPYVHPSMKYKLINK